MYKLGLPLGYAFLGKENGTAWTNAVDETREVLIEQGSADRWSLFLYDVSCILALFGGTVSQVLRELLKTIVSLRSPK